MIRAVLTALCAAALLGAAKVPTVDYRLGVVAQPAGPPRLEVEVAFHGDADGETRLDLPDQWASAKDVWRYVSDVRVSGADIAEDGPAVRVLRHRPNAKVTVRYRVQTAYDADPAGGDGNPYKGPLIRPDWMSLTGEFVFATPHGREEAPATFRWGRLPKGWRVASDLEHGRMGRPMTVDDVAQSITVGGPRLKLVERPVTGGKLRFAAPAGAPFELEPFGDEVAKIVSAQRAYWNDLNEPYFVAYLPLTPRPSGSSSGGTGRGDAFVLYATPNVQLQRMRWLIAHEHIHSWIPTRIAARPAKPEAAVYWISEGFTEFLTARTLARAGLASPQEAAAYWGEQLRLYEANPLKTAPNAKVVSDFWTDRNAQRLPYQRGMLLALKWDEDIRRKTGGKADLDDVVLRMRDHYRQFPPAQGPDLTTGLVSAAWVVAEIDLRPDIARYAEQGEAVPLPEQLFDGCLDARVTVTPAFDSGFDHLGSAAAKVVKGVRRGGPAWTSGLRDGMRIVGIDLKAGDPSREAVLKVLPAQGRGAPRTLRYWPYGDKDVETRALALAYGLEGEKLAACGRKIGGL
jgi:predicted metalloprotease with PDZ domain